jgi:TRAP-type C4-dicarboxylate transport system permease small subunit
MTVRGDDPGGGAAPHEHPATRPAGSGDGSGDYDEIVAVELLPAGGWRRSLLRAVGVVEQVVGASLIVVILALVLLQVAQRYLPVGGWSWTGEVARLALVWCTFALSGYLMAQDRHIAIRVIDLVLPLRSLGVVKLLAHVVVVLASAAMCYATIRLIGEDVGQLTPAAGIPVAWIYIMPMLGFALTAVRGLLWIGLVDLPEMAGREIEAP